MRARAVLALSLALNVVVAAGIATIAVRRLTATKPRSTRDVYERGRRAHFTELSAQHRGVPEVVMIGDSLTDWGEWHELLHRPVANRGVAGDRVADVAARLESALPGSPRVVFLNIGINDLLRGGSPEKVAEAHARLVADLRRRRPLARVVVTSLAPVHEALLAAHGDGLTQRVVAETNALLQRDATGAGAEWLDLAPHLARSDGQLDERFTLDGVHLSAEGYRAWATAVAGRLPSP